MCQAVVCTDPCESHALDNMQTNDNLSTVFFHLPTCAHVATTAWFSGQRTIRKKIMTLISNFVVMLWLQKSTHIGVIDDNAVNISMWRDTMAHHEHIWTHQCGTINRCANVSKTHQCDKYNTELKCVRFNTGFIVGTCHNTHQLMKNEFDSSHRTTLISTLVFVLSWPPFENQII